MNWARKYFNQQLEHITAEDLRSFFSSERFEDQHLEFKSGQVHKDKILKEVCAFLNAEGGLLIIGAPRELSGSNSSTGELQASTIPQADVLLREIYHRIEPAPKGVRVQQVKLDEGNAFLVEVPQSQFPPHQISTTGNYYIRDGASSRPARHHEVEDLFFKKRMADLQLEVELERPNDSVLVRLILSNRSTVSAREPAFLLQVWPVRQAPQSKFEVRKLLSGQYLAKDQRWKEELRVPPQQPRLFVICRYYAQDVEEKVKAVFLEIQHKKIKLLQVFNSEVHKDMQLWYDRYSYLLDEP